MVAKGWVEFESIKIPVMEKIKLGLARIFPWKGVRVTYNRKDGNLRIEAEFPGEQLQYVVNHFSKFIRTWEEQRSER